MNDKLRTIDDLDVEGRRVLLRADFDVPLTTPSVGVPVRVADDARIRVGLVTIQELRRRGARLVLVSELDGPKRPGHALSMRPVAERLGALTGTSVQFAAAVTGPRVRELTERLEFLEGRQLPGVQALLGDRHTASACDRQLVP